MSGGRKGASELGAGEGQGAKLLGRGASDHTGRCEPCSGARWLGGRAHDRPLFDSAEFNELSQVRCEQRDIAKTVRASRRPRTAPFRLPGLQSP